MVTFLCTNAAKIISFPQRSFSFSRPRPDIRRDEHHVIMWLCYPIQPDQSTRRPAQGSKKRRDIAAAFESIHHPHALALTRPHIASPIMSGRLQCRMYANKFPEGADRSLFPLGGDSLTGD